MPGLYVTGIESGVGKTTLIAALLGALRAHGHVLGVMRPLETACPLRHGRRYPQDAHYLRGVAGVMDELSLICPLAASESALPLAEHQPLEPVRHAAEILGERHAGLLIEGPGGLLIPLDETQTELDLMRILGLPVLLVVEARRGFLGHALMGLQALRDADLPVAGMVLNVGRHPRLDRSVEEALLALQRWGGAAVFGAFPTVLAHEAPVLAEAARVLDLRALVGTLGLPG